jgi:uncharacterized protein
VRIVLDTNVLISGLFFDGLPGRILRAWGEGAVQIVLSPEIFEEYQEVLEEISTRHPGIEYRPLLEMLLVHAEMIEAPSLPDSVSSDPEDDKFLACAVAGEVSYIVSGDHHLLKVSGYRGIKVLRPRTFAEHFL